MIKSEIILPIRFYDDLNNQTRFNRNCKVIKACDTTLKYSTTQLPHFQMKRESSLLPITEFYLREICSDAQANFYNNVPEGAANFGSGAVETFGSAPSHLYGHAGNTVELVAFKYDCGKLKSIYIDPAQYIATGPASYIQFNVLNCRNRVKIVVDKFERAAGSSLEIDLFDGVTSIGIITAPGVYIYDYTGTSGTLKVQFSALHAGDLVEISYLQVQTFDLRCYEIYDTDVLLDETKITTIPLDDGTDLFVYCEGQSNYQIAPGNYYYVIKCFDSRQNAYEFYYSEVFEIKSLKDIENYYRLKWWNTCDIGNIILYDPNKLDCDFYNIAYLNAELFKPEYPTNRELNEDGFGGITPIFNKLEKALTFETVCHEFITDALAAIFLHDNVYLLEPINQHREKQNSEYKIRNIEQDITDVLVACYQKVNLKLFLQTVITKTLCCVDAGEIGSGYRYLAHSTCDDHEFKLQITEPAADGDGLIRCSDDALIAVEPTDIILFNDDAKYYTLIKEGDKYIVDKIMPSIIGFTDTDPEFYIITGWLLPYSSGIMEMKIDAHDWEDAMVTTKADSTGAFTCKLHKSLASGAISFKVRVHCLNLVSDFGTSDSIAII